MKTSASDIPNLGNEWDFWFEHLKKLPADESRQKRRNSYYFILNTETCEIEYVSKTVMHVLGYKPEEFTIEKLFSIIHPDDLEYCRICEAECIEVSNGLQFEEHFRYSFQYSYRLMTSNGDYITIKQQYHAIEVDDYGRMLKTIVMQECIENYTIRPDDDLKVFDNLKNRPINLPSKYKLTKRELEILELVYKGYKSNEISEMLYLSKHTVDTHRKNILNKTRLSSSTIDLLNKE